MAHKIYRERDGSLTAYEVDDQVLREHAANRAREGFGAVFAVICTLIMFLKLLPLERGEGWLLVGTFFVSALIGVLIARPFVALIKVALALLIIGVAIYGVLHVLYAAWAAVIL